MNRRHFIAAASAAPGFAQTMYAPKGQPAVYTGPHKAHTKLSELKAKHKGEKWWRELIVDDKHLRSEYIYVAPGHGHPKAMHPTRERGGW